MKYKENRLGNTCSFGANKLVYQDGLAHLDKQLPFQVCSLQLRRSRYFD